MHRRRISFAIISKNENSNIQKNKIKNDYTIFKNYKLIALLNTMYKMLKSIIIIKITEFAKKKLLFSKSQMNDKKIETILKMLIEKIHST